MTRRASRIAHHAARITHRASQGAHRAADFAHDPRRSLCPFGASPKRAGASAANAGGGPHATHAAARE
ncbi:GTP cyclohydrolase [Burkholderia pseudomallei]|nr:GTP cyclohydrolase [Burkholderia pseudomallei]OMT12592.1 GTP cyclohydrolase [Burkholderia pseudomallei]OMT22856.1 GTP cyclohydrolase [Burkholderia pseudomallei]OMT27746.1 GTP cyclohydrolase [Burkholderia pseudomallei]OMV32874.1 GTP cyclohydrolase [Burkholderia pseudomallei]